MVYLSQMCVIVHNQWVVGDILYFCGILYIDMYTFTLYMNHWPLFLWIYVYKVTTWPYLVLLVSVSLVWKHKISKLELWVQVHSQVRERIEGDHVVTWVGLSDLLVFPLFAQFDWALLSWVFGRCNFGHFFFQVLFGYFSPFQNYIVWKRIRGGTWGGWNSFWG